MTAFTNLAASLSAYRYALVLGTPVRSAGSGVVSVPFTAFGPNGTSNTITVLEYSLNGSTWSTATPETPSELNNVEFSTEGAAGVLGWSAFLDLDQSLFNNTIYLRMRASDGTFITPIASVSFAIEKVVSTPEQRNPAVFSNNYKGVSGATLAEILKPISP